MRKLNIEEFMALSEQHPMLDVRSPGEYSHAHMPGAYSMPLFTDEERKIVGTTYKQEGREQAIKIGLGYFGPKMRKMVEQAEQIVGNHQFQNSNSKSQKSSSKNQNSNPNSQFPIPNAILLHCWRGGMRSAGVAWLLDLYGFNVYTLAGGYKSFRNWTLRQFERPYKLRVLGGYTGSGKTVALKELSTANHRVIDLEGIARHKGSAFGALGEAGQPTQEMFENELAVALNNVCNAATENEDIWIEDESQRIGLVNLPNALYKTMRESPVYFLDIPFEERLNYITQEYGKFKKEELVAAVMRIQKRLGGLNAKNAINCLLEDNYKESFRILLGYYDKYYERGLKSRGDAAQMFAIACAQVDAKANSKMLINQNTTA